MTKKRGTDACGHEWETAPDSVQSNVNCPACGAEHADPRHRAEGNAA